MSKEWCLNLTDFTIGLCHDEDVGVTSPVRWVTARRHTPASALPADFKDDAGITARTALKKYRETILEYRQDYRARLAALNEEAARYATYIVSANDALKRIDDGE